MFQNTTPQKSRSNRAVRQPSFLNQKGRPRYYEDIYRSRGPGEDDEISAEHCESESDSDVPVRTRSKKHRKDERLRDSGRKKKKELAKGNNKGSKGRTISLSSGSEEREEEDVPSSSKSVDQSARDFNEDVEYQIAPRLNRKHSLPTAEVRRLKARQCGLFSGEFGGSIQALRSGEYEEAVADDERSEVRVEDALGGRGRAKRESAKRRAAGRTSIKQQLAERVATRKQAQKAEKEARREEGRNGGRDDASPRPARGHDEEQHDSFQATIQAKHEDQHCLQVVHARGSAPRRSSARGSGDGGQQRLRVGRVPALRFPLRCSAASSAALDWTCEVAEADMRRSSTRAPAEDDPGMGRATENQDHRAAAACRASVPWPARRCHRDSHCTLR